MAVLPMGLCGAPDGGVNAVFDQAANTARILYPVTATNPATTTVSYVQKGGTLQAVLPDGKTLWTTPIDSGGLFGGFDFDADGWLDLGFVVRKPTDKRQGDRPLQTTQILLVKGKTGEVLKVTEPLEDHWWPALGYATPQWANNSILFGGRTQVFSLAPYYAAQGFFCRYTNGQFQRDRYEFPSTAAYDQAYRHVRTNAYGQTWCYVENAHVYNGLFLTVAGQDRLLFFTSARVVQYAVAPFGPDQLVCDHPFLNGHRTELAGRQYGLVSIDPAAPTVVTLVSGTHAYSVYTDMKTNALTMDPWGAIERHVTRYDAATDTLDHRFYSYAHDRQDGNKYQRRVVYPNRVYLPATAGHASRLAYNVYEDGHWQLHISKPGSTADETVLADLFLWDIVERDAQTQLIVSPAKRAPAAEAANGYFLQWRTDVHLWNEAKQTVTFSTSTTNAIPHLLPAFRTRTTSTSYGALYPVLRVAQDGGGKLLLERQDGRLVLEGE